MNASHFTALQTKHATLDQAIAEEMRKAAPDDATLRSLKCAAAAFVRHGREDDARRLHGVPRGNKEKSSRDTGVLRCSALGEPRVAYRVACDEARDDNECRTNDDGRCFHADVSL